MKSLYYTAGFLFLIFSVRACTPVIDFKLTVVDETGAPVEGALVGAGTFSSQIEALSDKQGRVNFKIRSDSRSVSYSGQKEGYYESTLNEIKFKEVTGGKWTPGMNDVKLELRRIVNPIPLYSMHAETKGFLLEANVLYGFDFMVGDWMPPHGRGLASDVTFLLQGKTSSLIKPFDANLKIATTHDGDGFVYVHDSLNSGCRLRLPHHAPLTGYTRFLTKSISQLPGNAPKGTVDYGRLEWKTDTTVDDNYFMRVRTVLDKEGKIVSCNYVKIHGAFSWDALGFVRFHYYFNPNKNDPNLEFDVTKNLFDPTGELAFERDELRVTEP